MLWIAYYMFSLTTSDKAATKDTAKAIKNEHETRNNTWKSSGTGIICRIIIYVMWHLMFVNRRGNTRLLWPISCNLIAIARWSLCPTVRGATSS